MLIDLSHEVEEGMITYKGLPGPVISTHLSRKNSRSHYAEGVEFLIAKIEMVANTGTYVDSPFHRYEDRQDVAELPLEKLANLDAILIHAKDVRSIDSIVLEGKTVKGKAVIICTGWDIHWRTDQYFEDHPYLTGDAVEYLVRGEAALVGIDSLNIDDSRDLTRPAHSLLLGAGIPIVEHLCNLSSLPDHGFRFFAVPPQIRKVGSFPVRAFAIV